MFSSQNLIHFSYLLFLCPIKDVIGLNTGDACSFKDGSHGVCRFVTDCPSASKLLKQGTFPTDICGFDGTQTIVCCHDNLLTVKVPAKSSLSSGKKPGERSDEKCKEYAQYAYDRDEQPTFSLMSRLSNKLDCPFSAAKHIVGGTRASRKEFPHMAHIGFNKSGQIEWMCGGSLISENFVLTAAHCVKSVQHGPAVQVRLGITNQTDINHKQEIRVREAITYPDYEIKYHDIGLLRLEKNADLNTFVRPACLQTKKNIEYNTPIATGWGKVGLAEEDSVDLLKVSLEFFSTKKCNATYQKDINEPDSDLQQGILEDVMICAGSSTEVKDTCKGDSGGPLQVIREDTQDIKCMYNIVGITAFGKYCGLVKNVPGVYTRVSAYIKWIEDSVWTE